MAKRKPKRNNEPAEVPAIVITGPPPDWRGRARDVLPDLAEEIDSVTDPTALWLKINAALDEAYEKPPFDNDLVPRIYAFADWCLLQPRQKGAAADQDLLTCVAVCFWEHVPTRAASRADMPRWFTREEVVANEHFFRHELDDKELEQVMAAFDRFAGSEARRHEEWWNARLP